MTGTSGVLGRQNESRFDPEFLLEAVARRRDKSAFIALFEYFAPRVKSYLMRSGLEAGRAEDIAQDVMLTVWEKAQSYNPQAAAASTWIFTIARNKRTDALRRAFRHDSGQFDSFLEEQEDSEQERPDDLLDRREHIETLSNALKVLPDEQAAIIRKIYFEDKTHRAVSEETGIPLGTVKSRIRLALERLKGELSLTDMRIRKAGRSAKETR